VIGALEFLAGVDLEKHKKKIKNVHHTILFGLPTTHPNELLVMVIPDYHLVLVSS
jgi:hypothetical protein